MIVAGMMSGTSADGIDSVLVDFEYRSDPQGDSDADHPVTADSADDSGGQLGVRVLASRHTLFPDDLHRDILTLLSPGDRPLQLVSSVDARVGQAYAQAAAELLEPAAESLGRDPGCELIVMHGQTVRHDLEDGRVTATLQLGQPAWVAERTGVPVLSDVRSADVAAGGQGAPLASVLGRLLLGGSETTTAMLNLGGIANVSIISPGEPVVAFDTGPANALIDIVARRVHGSSDAYDRDGELAAQGTVHEGLLQALLTEPYYDQPAPKSTGKELFHEQYLDRYLDQAHQSQAHQDHARQNPSGPNDFAPPTAATGPGHGALNHTTLSDADIIATLTRLTAVTIADACRPHDVRTVVASGGGTRNPSLMTELQHQLGDHVDLTTTDDAFGLPAGDKEAVLMALIGWLTWHGLPSTGPHDTGAARATIAGRLTAGHSPLRLPTPLTHAPTRVIVRS